MGSGSVYASCTIAVCSFSRRCDAADGAISTVREHAAEGPVNGGDIQEEVLCRTEAVQICTEHTPSREDYVQGVWHINNRTSGWSADEGGHGVKTCPHQGSCTAWAGERAVAVAPLAEAD